MNTKLTKELFKQVKTLREEGLEFSDAEGKVVDWLDKHFVLFELINPEFTYAQIKLKFGMARVYLQGLPSTCAQIAEDAINKIMKCEL